MKKIKTYKQFNEGFFLKDDNKKLLANLLTRLDIADHIEIKESGKEETAARIDAMADLKINWKRKTAEYGDKTIKLDTAALERIKAVLKFEPVKSKDELLDEYSKILYKHNYNEERTREVIEDFLNKISMKASEKILAKYVFLLRLNVERTRELLEKMLDDIAKDKKENIKMGNFDDNYDVSPVEKKKKCENCGKKVKTSEIEKGLCSKCFYDIMY